MSAVMTVIDLPKSTHNGFMDHGRKTRAEMIATIRDLAAWDKRAAEEILSAPDEAFSVRIVRGIYRQHLLKVL